MSTFAAAASLADKLIAKKGATALFTRTTGAGFDPVAQTGGASKVSFSMAALAVPPGKSATFRVGSLERRNILELHLAPKLGVTPIAGDKVMWAGAEWTVIWAEALDPAADGSPYAKVYIER